MKGRKILLVAALVGWIGSARAGGPYVDEGNGTISDQGTGLVWMKSTADTNGDGRITGEDRMTWQQALAWCEASAFAGGGWRLPNSRELKSLVDRSVYNPAIDSRFQCESSYYWSATTNANYPSGAWDVHFYNGNDNWNYKSNTYYVRCVRGGL